MANDTQFYVLGILLLIVSVRSVAMLPASNTEPSFNPYTTLYHNQKHSQIKQKVSV